MLNIERSTHTAVRPDRATLIAMEATLFVALELSLSNWVVVASLPGEAKASKHGVTACGPGLLALLRRLREHAERSLRRRVGVVVMQEAGRDGFWVHRLLEAHAIKSFVVDPSSIAVNRRSRRAKTDRIDAEAMLRTLMAWSRGERQVCAMVRPPTREAEDARRLGREREALLAERIRHANRIKGRSGRKVPAVRRTAGTATEGARHARRDLPKVLSGVAGWNGRARGVRLRAHLAEPAKAAG